jgi:proteasome lid subunit RPN8/RPN11
MTEERDDIALDPAGDESAGGRASQPVRVLLAESALEAMNQHAAEESDHEIGGVMVGTVLEGVRPVVLVEHIIRGTHMSHLRSSVTFTHESWAEINREMDEKYADKRMVGWYHSHPGFGIFLSGHDLFIHRNFFTMPWQIAFVTDPRSRAFGCFTWNNGDLVQDTACEVYRPTEGRTPPPRPTTDMPLPAAPVSPLTTRPTALDWGPKAALGLLAALLAIIIGLNLLNLQEVKRLRESLINPATAPNQLAPAPAVPATDSNVIPESTPAVAPAPVSPPETTPTDSPTPTAAPESPPPGPGVEPGGSPAS